MISFCSLSSEERIKTSQTLNDLCSIKSSELIGEHLFVTRSNLNSIFECTKVIHPRTSTLEGLLTDLQMKYRDTYEGVSIINYLYSTASKLSVIKSFRDETQSLLN